MNVGTTAVTVCSYPRQRKRSGGVIQQYSHRQFKLEAPTMTLNSSCVSESELKENTGMDRKRKPGTSSHNRVKIGNRQQLCQLDKSCLTARPMLRCQKGIHLRWSITASDRFSWITENVSKNGCFSNRAFKNFLACSRTSRQPADPRGSLGHSLTRTHQEMR